MSGKPKYSLKILARARSGPPIKDWLSDDGFKRVLEFLAAAAVDEQRQEQLADWIALALHNGQYAELVAILATAERLDLESCFNKRSSAYLQVFSIYSSDKLDKAEDERDILARLIQLGITVPKFIDSEVFEKCKQVITNRAPPVLVFPASAILLMTSGDPWIIDNADKAFSLWNEIASGEGNSNCYSFAIKWLDRASREAEHCKGERLAKVAKMVSTIMERYDYISWGTLWDQHDGTAGTS